MDSLKLETLKSIDINKRYLIGGYYRQNHVKLFNTKSDDPYYNVSELSIFVTLSYYAMIEYFSIINDKKVELSEDKTSVKKSVGGYWENTSYGTVEVDTATDSGIYIWEIKVETAPTSGFIGLGSDLTHTSNHIRSSSTHYHFAINLYTGDRTCKGMHNGYISDGNTPKISTGDIVKLELDLSNKCIKYHLNDKDLGVAFSRKDIENADENKYRLAVSLYNQDDCFRIISFQHKLK